MECTANLSNLINLIELLKECSVSFVYLGHLCFGTLQWKPCMPQPVQKTAVLSFKIIEEYTLDDQSSAGTTSAATDSTSDHPSAPQLRAILRMWQQLILVKIQL